ncbi:MAG: O-antigen ligase family protein [Candidatus Magasanikbacteria bacterium]|nr:O-antigen ligase family protein [Candidatus Magasanikbacteria bacterium]
MEKVHAQFKLESILNLLLRLFLFILPWQTIWIYQEKFLNGAKWQYGTMGWYGSEILLWVCIFIFMAFVFAQVKDTRYKIQMKAEKDRIFLGSILLFLLYSFLSIFWSVDVDVALQTSLRLMEAFFLFLMLYTSSLSFKQLAVCFVAGSVLPSVLGIFQFLMQTDFSLTLLGLSQHLASVGGTSVVGSESIGRWLRVYGPFPNPNIFGGYLALAFVIALMVYEKNPACDSVELVEIRQARKDYIPILSGLRLPAQGWSAFGGKIILYGVIALQITALFFSFSRAGWIAVGVTVFFYCLIGVFAKAETPPCPPQGGIIPNLFSKIPPLRGAGGCFTPPVILFVLLTSVLTFIFFPLVQTRFVHQSSLEIRSTEDRVSGYREAVEIFKEHFFVGVGAGNYTAELYQLNPTLPGYAYQPVHNVGLLFLAEFGIAGIILILVVLLSFWSYHQSQVTNDKFSIFNFQSLHVWYVLCAMWYVFLAFFDHYFLSSYVGLVLTATYFCLVFRLSPANPPSVPKV